MNNKIGFVSTPKEIAELMVKLSLINKKKYFNKDVLDTGCGDGIFLEALEKAGYKNCYGIELEKSLYKISKNKFGKKFNIIWGDFLSYPFKKKFDLIIGNPPYVHFNQLPANIKKALKKILGTSEGDIYYAFILRSIQLIREGGELIYIVPYHFFYNTYAKVVREMIIKNGKLEVVIDLDEVKLFSGESPETIIFKFKKGKFNLKREKIKVLMVKQKNVDLVEIYKSAVEAIKTRKENKLFSYKIIPHYLDSTSWSSSFFEIPKFPAVKLKEIAKVGVGLVSGFDRAFIIEKNDLKNFNKKEKKTIKKFVKAKNCKRYIINDAVLYILIDNHIKSEVELKNLYPNIFKKIIKYKKDMINRYLPNKKWFSWMALRNYNFLLENINKKRIYVPTLDRHKQNRFSLGGKGLLPSGDVLFIQPLNENDIYFLIGYLNSDFFRKYYLAKGGRRGGRISFTQRLLENVEIPLFSKRAKNKITKNTLKIIDKIKKNEDITKLNKEINSLIECEINNLDKD